MLERLFSHVVEARVGPIYRLADICGRYRYRHRYRYICISKWDIGIGRICIGIWISVISVSAKYQLKYMDIGQNISLDRQKAGYQLNISQNENIDIGIGDQYLGVNISVSAKILDVRIYLYRNRFRLDPYRSNPSTVEDIQLCYGGYKAVMRRLYNCVTEDKPTCCGGYAIFLLMIIPQQ
jgi:hypothetical protein